MRRQLAVKRDERGLSTIIVAICLIGLFGAAMLGVDAGNMWQTRRNVITATDATALQQAAAIARTNGTSCITTGDDAWTTTFTTNAGDGSTPISCNVFDPDGDGVGYVGVDGRKTAAARFGGLFNISQTEPYSYSAARYGYPLAIEGLRPIGLCALNPIIVEVLTGVRNPLNDDNRVTSLYSAADGEVYRFYYNKEGPPLCPDGTAPGNWGFVDFDGGANSENDLVDWMFGGYGGLVAPSDCDYNKPGIQDCGGDTGAAGGTGSTTCPKKVNNMTDALACIMSTASNIQEWHVPVYDEVDCSTSSSGGGGSNCNFNVIGFLKVRLWGFDISGAQSERYFDFEFVRGIATGPCCSTVPGTGFLKVVQLCAVDHDNSSLTEAQRCATS